MSASSDNTCWTVTKKLFKNTVSFAKTKESRALFLSLVSPFILTKVFPEEKYKAWALKCGVVRKSKSDCCLSVDYLEYITSIVTNFCMLTTIMNEDYVKETSKKLKSETRYDVVIGITMSNPLYLQIKSMSKSHYDNKKFPGFVTILIAMYNSVIVQLKSPDAIENMFVLNKEAEKFKENGNEFFKIEKYDEAINLYSTAISRSPFSAMLYSNRSIAHLKNRNTNKALRDARIALIINPMWPKVYYRLAQVADEIDDSSVALDIIQDGLRLCELCNISGSEVEKLIRYKLELCPKVGLSLFGSLLQNKEDKSTHYLDPIFENDMMSFHFENPDELVRLYRIMLEKSLDHEFKVSDNELYNLKFCLAMSYLNLPSVDALYKCLSLTDSLLTKSTPRYKQLSYFINSRVYYSLFSFNESEAAALKGLEAISEDQQASFEVIYWIKSHEVPIDISIPGRLEVELDNLLTLCHVRPLPAAICRYELDKSIPKRQKHSKCEMYIADPNFKGYVQLTCVQRCILHYHLTTCWKYLKEDMNLHNEKEFLGSKCLTPDCDAAICKVDIINKDRSTDKCFEISKEQAIGKLKQPNEKSTKANSNDGGKRRKHRSSTSSTISSSKSVNNANASNDLSSDDVHLNPDKDNLVLELISKVESLTQKVQEFKLVTKENKIEMEKHRKVISKVENDRTKLQEELKIYKTENKLWKTDCQKFEKEFLCLRTNLDVLKTELDLERANRKALEETITLLFQRCDEAEVRTKEAQVMMLGQTLTIGQWMLSWAQALSENKVNKLLNGNATEDIVLKALSAVQDLQNKNQSFRVLIDNQIQVVKTQGAKLTANISLPVSIESLMELLLENLHRDNFHNETEDAKSANCYAKNPELSASAQLDSDDRNVSDQKDPHVPSNSYKTNGNVDSKSATLPSVRRPREMSAIEKMLNNTKSSDLNVPFRPVTNQSQLPDNWLPVGNVNVDAIQSSNADQHDLTVYSRSHKSFPEPIHKPINAAESPIKELKSLVKQVNHDKKANHASDAVDRPEACQNGGIDQGSSRTEGSGDDHSLKASGQVLKNASRPSTYRPGYFSTESIKQLQSSLPPCAMFSDRLEALVSNRFEADECRDYSESKNGLEKPVASKFNGLFGHTSDESFPYLRMPHPDDNFCGVSRSISPALSDKSSGTFASQAEVGQSSQNSNSVDDDDRKFDFFSNADGFSLLDYPKVNDFGPVGSHVSNKDDEFIVVSSKNKPSFRCSSAASVTNAGRNSASKMNSSQLPVVSATTFCNVQRPKLKLSQHKKLMLHLQKYFPTHTEEELSNLVRKVRTWNNNTLTGLTMETISNKVSEYMTKGSINDGNLPKNAVGEHKSSITEAGSSSCTPAPWANRSDKKKWEPDIDSKTECIICHEEYDSVCSAEVLLCGHAFHHSCITEWLKEQQTCPVCRVRTLSSVDFPMLG